MAADILAMDANYVPVGIDQKQHVELTRDIAIRFNKKYGNTFVVPEPIINEVGTKIMDLKNPEKKMSKSNDSDKGTINLLDKESVIRKKIMSAETDSGKEIKFDPATKPGISNLMNILAALTDLTIEEIEIQFKDSNYGEFKKYVADIVVNEIKGIQERYKDLIDSRELDKVLDAGKGVSSKLAEQKLEELKKKVGLYR